ncbi:methylenetetrahydrofolate dehydrogenase (NADP+)/methenyltetrahydrofolate cyclohydrolase [Roseivirga ehrenbergii]|uniref:Bifunctional protein FolD n=1 Tax=Roseivirga ehrenbergii (strain DSM 102268 / JCM 13514 / KCTC 12282 / NCIMB 14502 / KMM 6017) TaxID=279360 RepID=A0A150XR33_ROSEK|nr:bifunctional methylenetetrahydrofolate dehydrogenase/methenyltetrahydrofolate cyclohydrolase FolD [Roseivirga ehrenbergii]KYG81042.1 bifunctional 5,10-methylene-tetrahydrofolate dehydrogenase/5,10-methylene-tetrahydrofolate cyclohydrolase [Roseivirga ehrenbergii]TCL00911.1 methylenetetrahydrofolate dehydrogenase (NADP+)/methenyltetrahydrofolate cyclohydrolase [Roseivirga ehrenbergii]
MQLLDGKGTAQSIKDELKNKVAQIKAEGGKTPHLAAVLVGNDGASQTYVNAKVKACEQIGFGSTLIHLPEETSEVEVLATVQKLNEDPEIDGFIVQVPLPKQIDEQKVVEAILPNKDVDGFHPVNLGKMLLGLPTLLPATPKGMMLLLERNGIETSGKHCVVIGRSNTVGTPISVLMSRNGNPGNATVTLCHSRTKNLAEITKQADILIVAIGKEGFVSADMVKEGATVIDVGIHRVPSDQTKSGFKLKGDVKFDEVAPKCEFITPVPGGVGPMTIASLLWNTYLTSQKLV